jgi:hypothetical protein
MRRPLARALLCSIAGLLATTPATGAPQGPAPAPASRVEGPARDPVTVRGCLEKRWLRILEHDSTDLSGVARVRLKGSRAMLALVDDGRGTHVEVTGDLDLGRRDRLETRRKYRPGSKTTVSIGASAEQVRGADVSPPEATLIVDAITRLGDQCPSR